MTITNSIIRIIDPGGETKGTGFIVADDLAVTCAHIVEFASGGSGQTVRFVFHATGQKASATVETHGWRDPTAEDIAILRLDDGPLPEGIAPLPLWWAKESAGHPFSSFGFKAGDKDEGHVTGYIRGLIIEEGRWLQLSSNEISLGISGAPVFNTQTKRVVGVISEFPSWKDPHSGRKMAGDSFGRQTEINYATPTEVLLEIWPELESYLQPDPHTEKIKEYRDYILKETCYVTMKGVSLLREVGKVPLDKVYIELQAVKQKTLELQRVAEKEELAEAARAEQVKVPHSPLSAYLIRQFGEQFYRQGSAYRTDERPEPISPAEALKEHKGLVILGAPGSGKSTILRWLARQAVLQSDELIPILVSAQDFSTARKDDSTVSLQEFALKQIKKHKPDLLDALQQEAAKPGKVLWLVDALDEARGEHGRDVVEQVKSLTGQIVVTSRPVGYPDGLGEPQFNTFEVLPLVSENIDQFITNWFALLAKNNQPQQAWLESRRQWFKDTIEKQTRLKPLLKNPLLLTFLVILASEKNRHTLPMLWRIICPGIIQNSLEAINH